MPTTEQMLEKLENKLEKQHEIFEKKLEKQQEKVAHLMNLAWVLGTLAVIFGITGGWGAQLLTDARGRLGVLEGGIDSYLAQTKTIRREQLKIYEDSLKAIPHPAENQISDLHSRIDRISIQVVSDNTEFFHCQGAENGVKVSKASSTDLTFMYGHSQVDGGCKGNNFYKKIALVIPKK